MMKKAQGLSINTVIVAVIALVVLGVIIFIFYSQITNIASGFSDATKTADSTQPCKTGFLGTQECLKGTSCPTTYDSKPGKCEDPNTVCCEKKKPSK